MIRATPRCRRTGGGVMVIAEKRGECGRSCRLVCAHIISAPPPPGTMVFWDAS